MFMNFATRLNYLNSGWRCGVAVLAGIALQGSTVFAFQDNPFATDRGGQTSSFTTSPPAVGASDDAAGDSSIEVFKITSDNARSDTGLVVRSVRMADPKAANDLLNAVETLLDVEAIGDARFYLDKLVKQNLSQPELFELFQLRGTEFFYQLHASDALAPVGQTFAKQVLTAAKAYAISPQRIDQLVKKLSDDDINVRSNALAQLKRIGTPAYAAMLEVFVDENRRAEFNGIRGGVQNLDNDATEVLIAAARSGNAQLQAEAYVALTKLRSEEALTAVGYLYLSPKTSPAVKQLALKSLQRGYQKVDRQRLYCDIAKGAQASLKVIETGFDSSAMVNDWTFDKEKKKFFRSRIPAALAAKRLAAIQAELLYEIQPGTTFNRQLFMLTQLESAKRAVGADAVVDAKALLKKFGNPTAGELDSLLKRALQLKLMPAAIAICELMKQQADPALLHTSDRSQLIEAILYGDRHLQFAAFDAINRIDPQTAYPGSSHVMELAVFLAETQGIEKALVGHLLGPSSQSYASVVSSSGLSVSSARNGHQFYNMAIEGPDFQIFIVTESLAKPAALELIQLLRSDWRTRQVPIGFVGSGALCFNSIKILAQTDPLLRPLELNFNSRIVASQLEQLKSLSSSWPVSATSRLLHGQVAANWMLKTIDQKQERRFYQVHKYEDSIYRLLSVDGYTEKACQMIARLGTAKSQEALAKFASQSGYTLAQRETATKCFADSVQRFGTLLTTDQIQRQYDRYNASETDSAEVQKLMGQMLDAIEKRSLANKKSG
jgi:hypothetical protein